MCSTAMPSMRPAPNIRAVADPRWSPKRKRFRLQMMTAEYNSPESFVTVPYLYLIFFHPNVLLSRRYCILSFSGVSVRFRTCGASTRPTKMIQRNEAYDERDQMKRPASDVQHRASSPTASSVQRPVSSVQSPASGVRSSGFESEDDFARDGTLVGKVTVLASSSDKDVP